jgi:NADP-dependent 3-hydroxy acid dehydrogenase YdfG
VLEWTAYQSGSGPGGAGDLTTADSATIRSLFDVSVVGLTAAVPAVLPDLKQAKDPALLVTNGAAGYIDPNVDAMMVQYNLMGLGVSNAANHKLVGLLAEKLKSDGIYVAEIMIAGSVKGTAFDRGQATIDPSAVAAKYWEMYTGRKELRANMAG